MVLSTYRMRYRQHLLRRGYDPDSGAWSALKQAVLGCWAQPGFHRFWQAWNPWVGYLLFWLYLRLGGKRRRVLATMGVFLVCGLFLDLFIIALCSTFCVTFTVAFFCFGLLTLLSRALEPYLQQHRWPAMVNRVVNVGLVVGSLHLALALQRGLTA
jgi:hypothetical protein